MARKITCPISHLSRSTTPSTGRESGGLDDNPTTPPSWSRETEQEKAKASAREAEGKYRRAGEAVAELRKRGEAAQLRQAAAAERAAESPRKQKLAISTLDRIREAKERMLREKEADVIAAEMEGYRKRGRR